MRMVATCHSCGKSMDYVPCFEKRTLPKDARCNVLSGWLTVSQWKGVGYIDQYDYCSIDCLLTWVKAQLTQIPETFLDAFQDGSTQKETTDE